MEILRRAPMLAVLAALVSGSAVFDHMGGLGFVVIVPAVYAAVMFLSYQRELPEQWRVFAVGLVICAVCSLRMYSVLTMPPAQNKTLARASGTVQSVRTWGRIYVAVIDTDDGGRYVTRLQFAEMMPGDRIAFDGVTQSLTRRPRSPHSDFDEARYWGARGVSSWVKIYNVRELPARFSLPRMRYLLSRKISLYLPEKVSAYLKAALLGEREQWLYDQHKRWGTVHLLAVSGFHVGIVILLAGVIFGRRTIILSVILWLYVLLSGAAASALRAGLMMQTALVSRALGRDVNGVNSVSVAGVVLLMNSPLMFWDIGFRLSVLAALVISALPRRKLSWLMISPAVSLVTFPQVSSTFGGIKAVGLVLNVFAPLFFTFALSISSILGGLALKATSLVKYLVLPSEGIFLVWEWLADLCADFFPQSISWNYLVAWLGAGTLMFCLCRYFRFGQLRTFAVMTAGSLAAFVIFL